MALGPRLELRQGQSLVMTPQLQQAIKMLQLSNLDLSAYVQDELDKNPLLERQDETGDAGPGDATQPDAAQTRDPGEPRAEDLGDGPDRDEWGGIEPATGGDAGQDGATLAEAAASLDTDQENIYPDTALADRAAETRATQATSDGPSADGPQAGGNYATPAGGARGGSFDDSDDNLEARLTRAPSLREHLTEQMLLAIQAPVERLIAANLIDTVDEAGYLTEDIDTIAARLGADVELVEAILICVQGFDPVGVGARSLAECLSLQLHERAELDAPMRALLDNLHLAGAHDLGGLARACDLDKPAIAGLLARIRKLNPKPGLAFGDEVVQPVVPDIFVRVAADGNWAIELNSDTLPRVLVDRAYYGTVAKGTRNAKEKTFLSECLQNANWLVKSLDQRARTILKVARAIVREQDNFLALGVGFLRPLNLKTIAEAVEMHESTISRVTVNKYISTPRGIFELKYFFSSAIPSVSGGEAV
ncbi:MAG: RNA polymerase factor sigma-54, partial [Alphaproteobacteria bacterium]